MVDLRWAANEENEENEDDDDDDKGSRVEGGGRAGRGCCGLGLMDPCAVNLQTWNLSLSRTHLDYLHTRYTLSLTLQEHLPRLGCMCIVMAQTLRLSPVHRER